MESPQSLRATCARAQSFNAKIQWKIMYAGHHHFQEEKKITKHSEVLVGFWWITLNNRNFLFFLTVPKEAASIQGCHAVDIKQDKTKTFKSEGKAKVTFMILLPDLWLSFSVFGVWPKIWLIYLLSWKIILYFFIVSFVINIISSPPLSNILFLGSFIVQTFLMLP